MMGPRQSSELLKGNTESWHTIDVQLQRRPMALKHSSSAKGLQMICFEFTGL